MTNTEVFLQQLIYGLSNGMIIALVALGYTMVYGIVELINFAHGDVFTLGGFLTLTIVGVLGAAAIIEPGALGESSHWLLLLGLVIAAGVFCGGLNLAINRIVYKPLRSAPKLTQLVAAIGVSFILVNIALFWGGAPMKVFGGGNAAAASKDFPEILEGSNLLGDSSNVVLRLEDIAIFAVTIPLMIGLTLFVKKTRLGRGMRATAQNPIAAKLMGIDTDRVIAATFLIGGFLGGAASVMWSVYNNTISFQMGFRAGMDAFTAAVLGGIGSLPGAMVGGVLIGLIRAMSDQYIETRWTNVVVFGVLILILIFRPSGLLGLKQREKV
ncbi:MAG: branched-chain amino acid ABC transporter permease [Planctomycetota bacterium]|jgi:branched-chain amino acid transport system permease protein|nr:MAG: branched-chain amino acid ABC transporter permease [Planctomycetota bacterium]